MRKDEKESRTEEEMGGRSKRENEGKLLRRESAGKQRVRD